ncbi:hypothetical protein M3Y94_00684100 [Aphelenchoides besseyi]|nr:hypothetical protein M3Y94_00684100 [Aphelenchoides besseyi]
MRSSPKCLSARSLARFASSLKKIRRRLTEKKLSAVRHQSVDTAPKAPLATIQVLGRRIEVLAQQRNERTPPRDGKNHRRPSATSEMKRVIWLSFVVSQQLSVK